MQIQRNLCAHDDFFIENLYKAKNVDKRPTESFETIPLKFCQAYFEFVRNVLLK